MEGKAKSVSISCAKSQLSSLVRRAMGGEEITITRNGVAVARLVPIERKEGRDPRRAAARIRELRKGIKVGRVTIRGLIQEGRL